jgi:Na+/alanine symporter
MGPVQTVPYAPHPGELIAAGMRGPFLARDGAEIVAARFTQADDAWWRRWVIVLAGFVLAVSTIVAWAEHGSRGARQLLGARASVPTKVLVVGAATFGGFLTLEQVLGMADAAVAVAAIPNLLAIALCVPQLRQALRNDDTDQEPTQS